jgi:hypothetical protein
MGTAGTAFSDQIGSAGTRALQLFATRFPMASAAVMEFAKATGATVGAIVDLAKTAQDGAASVSSVTGALSSLPYGLGQLAKAATFAAQVLEKNIATQENLAKSGANFSGNLDLIRQSAAKTYLGLDQFGSVVSKNADVFSTMAGNVQKGTNRFVAIQNELLAPGSSTANNLATLGYSFQDAANLTTSYMRQQGTMNKQGLQDNQKIAASVAQYGRELDVLSKLTGQSREAIEQKLAAENQEAQFQAYLASLAPAEAEKLQQGIRAAMAQGGQGAVDALKAMAMGFPPMTEAAQIYTATQRAGVSALEQYNRNAKNAGITTEENAKKNARILAQQISQGAKDREQLQQVLRADALAGGNLSKSFADATKLQIKFKDMTEEQIAVELEKMNVEAARASGQAEEGKKQMQVMMDLTNQILARVMPAFNFLLRMVLKVAEFFGKITSIFDSEGELSNIEKRKAEGKISEVEAKKQTGGVVGETVGQTAGVLAGAAMGAAVGSAVPIIGTLLGGIVGGALGLYGGGTLGKKTGETIMGPGEKPKMANGGIVTQPTNILAGEAGSEAIVPLRHLESLRTELETLNKNTIEMLRYMKETAEYARKNVDATNGLSGDLFKF